MLAPLSLCLILLASLGCQARPNSPSDPMGKDGEDHPLPRLLDIQQYLKDLKQSIRHIPHSSDDAKRQAEVKRKQMDLIRQHVYEALAPMASSRDGFDGCKLQRPSGSGALAKPPRPCWGSLLTCLQAGIPPNFHQHSFATPALTFPCHGHDCDRKVLAKPLRRPTYTTARPYGGTHRHKNLCKNHQASCHHNRILPTYVPIRFNKLPTRTSFITTSPGTTTNYVEEKHQSSTTTQKYFTLPEKLYNLAVNPSTTPSVIDTLKPKDLRDGSVKLENEILGLTEKHHLNHGLKSGSSIQNKYSTEIELTTQSHVLKNDNTLTTQTITMTGNSLNAENAPTSQHYYMPKNTLAQTNTSLKNTNRTSTNEGDMTYSKTVKEATTVTQRMAFDENLLTTQVTPMDTISKESKAEPNVPVDHVSPDSTTSPASEYTTLRAALHEDLLTTQISLIDSTSQKIKAEPSDSVSSDSTISPSSEYTTLRTSLEEVLLPTHIYSMDSAHQKSKAKPNLDVDHLSPNSFIFPSSEYTTLRVDVDEVFLATQISLMDTKPGQDRKVESNQPVSHFSIDSFIYPGSEFTTLRTALGEVHPTTQLISKDIEAGQEITAEPNLPVHSSTASSIDPTSEYPIIDSSTHVALPTTLRIEDSTITVSIKEEAISKISDVEEPKQILAEEDSQPSESTPPKETLLRGESSIYLTTEIIEDSSTVIGETSRRTDADYVPTTAVIRAVETGTTEFPFETTTLQFESKTDNEQIFDQGAENSKNDLTANVPEQKEITGNLSLSREQNPHNISYAMERAAFSDLENEQRAYQDGVWKFTSELENHDDRFANDEGAAPTSNDEIALGHRVRRTVASELKLEPHTEASMNNSSLSYTATKDSTTINATNILELWPVIREGYKNNAFAEEDKKVNRSIFGQMTSLLGEDALAEITKPDLLVDETSRIKEIQEDYEYHNSTEEGIREKISRKIAKLGKELVARLPVSVRNKLINSFSRSSRGKRSSGVQPVSEAAAILALLAEGGGTVQLDSADDEDGGDYEYYGYEDDEEYENQYEDVEDEYDNNPSFKELIVLANKHRRRKETKS